jgi:hypothetical protein
LLPDANFSIRIRQGGLRAQGRLCTGIEIPARATKDIDLTLSAGVIQTSTFGEQRLSLREHIQSYASRTLPDYFEYFIGSSTLDLEGAPEEGFRFRVAATMDGRVFANFHVGIGVGDATDPTR